MTIESTKDKLLEMHLTAMHDAFIQQLENKASYDLSFEDRFGILVDVEYTAHRNEALERLIRNADFPDRKATVCDINYTAGRKLNRELIERLATCEYIREQKNVFITGATGCGKTFLSNALGLEACRNGYATKYTRLPDFLIAMRTAKDLTYQKLLRKFSKPALLIIDEWLLMKPDENDQHFILELLEKRTYHSSTIFCSQYQESGWYERLGGHNSPLAESILDRIVHNSYKIDITSLDPEHSISMREVYGLDKSLSR